MKSKYKIIGSISFLALLLNFSLAIAQNSNTNVVLKSKIVHEEKITKGVKTVEIESEEKYDSKGNVIDEVQYKDGKVDKHVVYEYDANNNKIKETELEPSGKIKKVGEFKYVNGVRTEKLTYDAAKKLISRKTYTYNY